MAKKNMHFSVLVVEDDASIATLLRYNLEKAGFVVSTAENGDEALILVDENKPDIVLLDWMLPGLSGIAICKSMRRKEETAGIPIIMLSARGDEADKVDGLEAGVDDYLVKPFSSKELMARINAVMRRIRPSYAANELSYGNLKMDLSSHIVTYKNTEIKMGPTEYKLLQSFLEHPKRVLTREQLIRHIWGDTLDVEPRTVDVHINRLRKSLNVDRGFVIRTIRSAGYCLQSHNAKDADPIGVRDSEIISADEE
jgi:two-component system phosphate regulon response regulator PhoB